MRSSGTKAKKNLAHLVTPTAANIQPPLPISEEAEAITSSFTPSEAAATITPNSLMSSETDPSGSLAPAPDPELNSLLDELEALL